MLLTCRTALAFIIVIIALFIVTNDKNIHISSDLKDLSPAIAEDKQLQNAINTVSKNIERQFYFILISDNQKHLITATKILTQQLNHIESIQLNTSDDFDQSLETLKSYRFQLLTPKQRSLLENQNTDTMLEKARRNLFRMDSSSSLLAITENPLGLFNDYFIHITNMISINEENTQAYKKQETLTYHSIISAKIKRGAMNIDTQKKLSTELSEIAQTITEKHPVKLVRTGIFFFAADAVEKSKKDITFISTSSTIGIVALLLFIFFSLYALVIPFISITIGILFGVAINHWLYGSIHILTIVFGASLIGIIIDYSLHYFYHHNLEKKPGKNSTSNYIPL